MPSYQIKDDIDLKDSVRDLTGYRDNRDELPEPELNGIIETMKLRLSTKFSDTNWYSDDGYSLVLLGATCIYCKAQVENYSVDSYSIGDESIEVSNATPEDSSQFQLWKDMVVEGTKNSSVLESSSSSRMLNTSEYIG